MGFFLSNFKSWKLTNFTRKLLHDTNYNVKDDDDGDEDDNYAKSE